MSFDIKMLCIKNQQYCKSFLSILFGLYLKPESLKSAFAVSNTVSQTRDLITATPGTHIVKTLQNVPVFRSQFIVE
jgi:hypothetical protein